VLHHRLGLFAGHAVEPVQEIVYRGAAFEVFKPRAGTGGREFLKTHAPLIFAGTRSTAEH
jgi:hypothetical protein